MSQEICRWWQQCILSYTSSYVTHALDCLISKLCSCNLGWNLVMKEALLPNHSHCSRIQILLNIIHDRAEKCPRLISSNSSADATQRNLKRENNLYVIVHFWHFIITQTTAFCWIHHPPTSYPSSSSLSPPLTQPPPSPPLLSAAFNHFLLICGCNKTSLPP